MKYCSKCGKEIMDEAVLCMNCGCPVDGSPLAQSGAKGEEKESNGIAIGAIICAFLVPIVGLILGIVGCAKYKNGTLRRQCVGAIFISISVWILSAIILASMM